MDASQQLSRRVVALAALAFSVVLHASTPATVPSELGQGGTWGAQSWTSGDLDQFGGEPHARGDASSTLLVRYHYYVSDYDTAKLAPKWVAHIDTQASAQAAASRKAGQWDRGQYTFTPDANVVNYSQAHHLAWVTNADYTNANPPGLKPVTAKNRITRGHMASNLEMKGHGDDQAGMQSQEESFSFANVCPQMQGHNAPLWAALENDCLQLAARVGRVAVITGPVYAADAAHPLLTTEAPRGKCKVPIPTHFFKIIIASVHGHTEAVAFLVPHLPDLTAEHRFDFAVGVRKVEEATGINFMPAMGPNDEVEDHPSDELLDLLQQD